MQQLTVNLARNVSISRNKKQTEIPSGLQRAKREIKPARDRSETKPISLKK